MAFNFREVEHNLCIAIDSTMSTMLSAGEDYGANNDDVEDVLNDAGLDLFDLELMDDDERAEVLEDAGLDPDDFDF